MSDNNDEKFEELLAGLLDKDELELLRLIIKNKGELEEGDNVQN